MCSIVYCMYTFMYISIYMCNIFIYTYIHIYKILRLAPLRLLILILIPRHLTTRSQQQTRLPCIAIHCHRLKTH